LPKTILQRLKPDKSLGSPQIEHPFPNGLPFRIKAEDQRIAGGWCAAFTAYKQITIGHHIQSEGATVLVRVATGPCPQGIPVELHLGYAHVFPTLALWTKGTIAQGMAGHDEGAITGMHNAETFLVGVDDRFRRSLT